MILDCTDGGDRHDSKKQWEATRDLFFQEDPRGSSGIRPK